MNKSNLFGYLIGVMISLSASLALATDLERLKTTPPEDLSFAEVKEMMSHKQVAATRKISVLRFFTNRNQQRYSWNEKEELLRLAMELQPNFAVDELEVAVADIATQIMVDYEFEIAELMEHENVIVRKTAVLLMSRDHIVADRTLIQKIQERILVEDDESVLDAILSRSTFIDRSFFGNFETVLPKIKSPYLIASILDILARGSELKQETFAIVRKQATQPSVATAVAIGLLAKVAFLKKTRLSEQNLRFLPSIGDIRIKVSKSYQYGGNEKVIQAEWLRAWTNTLYYGLQGSQAHYIAEAVFGDKDVDLGAVVSMGQIMSGELKLPSLPISTETLVFWQVVHELVTTDKAAGKKDFLLLEKVPYTTFTSGMEHSNPQVREIAIRLTKIYLDNFYDEDSLEDDALHVAQVRARSKHKEISILTPWNEGRSTPKVAKKCGGGNEGPFKKKKD